MIIIEVLAKIPITSHYYFFFVVRIVKIKSPSFLAVYNTVLLTIITMVCIRYLELIHLPGAILYSQTTSPQFPHPQAPGDHHSVSMRLAFLDTSNIILYLSFSSIFVCLRKSSFLLHF